MSAPVSAATARAALLSVTVVWGLTFVVIADALRTTTPFIFNAARFALAAAVVALGLAWRGGWRARGSGWRELRDGSTLGLLLFGGFMTQTIGLESTTPGKAGFITGLAVVLVPFLGWALFRLRVSRIEWAAALLSLLGLFLLTLQGGVFHPTRGDAWVLAGAVCFGLHVVMTDRFVRRQGAQIGLLTLIQLSVVATASLCCALGQEGGLVGASWRTLADPQVAVAVLICGVLATAYAYFVQSSMQRWVSPAQVALIYIMEPVFAAVFDFLFNHRALGGVQLAGALLIVLAMGLAEVRPGRRKALQEG